MSKSIADKSEDWSKIVGMPDHWDKKNIAALIETFAKTTFTIPISDEKDGPTITMTGAEWIRTGTAEAKDRHQIDGNLKGNEYGEKSKDMEMRVMTTIPKPLHMKLMEGYPTLLKDEKQLKWFMKNFPMFVIPRKI